MSQNKKKNNLAITFSLFYYTTIVYIILLNEINAMRLPHSILNKNNFTISNNFLREFPDKLLEAVAINGLFNDSKSFVDKPLKIDFIEVLNKFEVTFPEDVNAISKTKLKKFIDTYFYDENSDLEKLA